MEVQQSQQEKRLRVLPAAGMFLGGAVYALLSRGVFGAYDVLVRVVITGTVAAMSTLLLTWFMQRKISRRIENP
jgi:hypothetical protein